MDILKIKSINKDLIDKIQRYIIFLRLKFVFKITGKKLHPELKKQQKTGLFIHTLRKSIKNLYRNKIYFIMKNTNITISFGGVGFKVLMLPLIFVKVAIIL